MLSNPTHSRLELRHAHLGVGGGHENPDDRRGGHRRPTRPRRRLEDALQPIDLLGDLSGSIASRPPLRQVSRPPEAARLDGIRHSGYYDNPS